MNAHLLLPLNALPPYQTVLFYPGDSAFRFPWDHPFTTQYVEFLLRNGRAVMYPFFKGMHDGSGMPQLKRLEYRDRVIEWYKDLARSVDYLETRADIDTNKLAFYGFSRGAMLGPIFVALEPRFKVSVLLSGGFAGDTPPPETYVLNFVPRVKVPTLMLHGRYDGIRPLETHGRPLFQLLGAPEARKRLAVTESGHIVPMNVVIPETLNWLDRYLGPVRRR